jgi:ATP-dependent DNA ligase
LETNLKPLYHRDRKGAIRIWKVWADGEYVKTEYGHLGGQMITSSYKCESKNVGRSNATTAAEQAVKEAESFWKEKKRIKYSEDSNKACAVIRKPMLAKLYNAKKTKLPQYGQPKLDGVRATAYWEDGKVVLQSRGGKFYTGAHEVVAELEQFLPQDSMLDGELYIHGVSCQVIVSYAKARKDGSKKLQFHVYDYPIVEGNETLTWEQRLYKLGVLIYGMNAKYHGACGSKHIIEVDTELILTDGVLDAYETKCIEEGYEGIMLRDPAGLYQFGYRSSELVKLKRFEDAEFEVVECYAGIGKFEKLGLFLLKNDNGTDQTFEVAAPGDFEERAQFLIDGDKYIGKKLTVQFQGRTDSGIPRFPIGRYFREDEDLPMEDEEDLDGN